MTHQSLQAGEQPSTAPWRRFGDLGFARQALTLGGGNALAQAVALGLSPWIARLYSPEAFGLFAVYAALVGPLAVAATLQYEAAIMLPRYHRQAACVLLFIVLLCPGAAILFALPLVVFRGDIAALVGEPRLALWILLLPVSVVLVGWYKALRFWTMRREAFGDLARNVVTRAASGAIFACVFGIFPPLPGAPEGGLILSQVLGEAFGNLLLACRILRRDKAVCFSPGWYRLLAAARRWRSLALPLAAAQGIAISYGRLPVLAITWLFGPVAAGYYAWAERFAVVPAQLVATAIGDVYRQRATVEYHRRGRFDHLMRRTLVVTTLLGIVPFALGIAIAPALFAWLFGLVWREAGVLAQILMVGGFVSFVVGPVDKAAVIFRRTGYMLAWHLARFGLKLGVIATAVVLKLSLATVLWLIVAVRIGLYCVDVVYEYRLAKGGSFRPRVI